MVLSVLGTAGGQDQVNCGGGKGEADFESVSNLSNEQVLALTELQIELDQNARLSELLDRQQAVLLADNERLELQTLMRIYQEGLLQKATALSEAIKRKLIVSGVA